MTVSPTVGEVKVLMDTLSGIYSRPMGARMIGEKLLQEYKEFFATNGYMPHKPVPLLLDTLEAALKVVRAAKILASDDRNYGPLLEALIPFSETEETK